MSLCSSGVDSASWLVWLLGSLLLLVLQAVVLGYNACRVVFSVSAYALLGFVREALRRSCRGGLQAVEALEERLEACDSPSEWERVAAALDAETGALEWRRGADGSVVEGADLELMRKTTQRLREARLRRDDAALKTELGPLLSRKFAGLTSPELYLHARTGTRMEAERLVEEACACVRELGARDERWVEGSRVALGRTALCLSGGGTLAMLHLGVVKALLSAGLLPRVISGTSGGSIVAAMLAMHTDEEMEAEVIREDVADRYGLRWFSTPLDQLLTFARSILSSSTSSSAAPPAMMDTASFVRTCKAYFTDHETFASAFQRTGRVVTISVTVRSSSFSNRSHPLLLSYLTSPDVYLWSAVAASCALPGLMRPTELMAKGADGTPTPFHPEGFSTSDGSLHSDIPTAQLALLFSTNHFIVSQVNPHIAPLLRPIDGGTRGGELWTAWRSRGVVGLIGVARLWLAMDVSFRLRRLAQLRLVPRVFGHEVGGVFLQKYTGDITIAPPLTLMDKFKVITHPSSQDMKAYIKKGFHATMPHLPRIKTTTAIEKALETASKAHRIHPTHTSPSHTHTHPTTSPLSKLHTPHTPPRPRRASDFADFPPLAPLSHQTPILPPPPSASKEFARGWAAAMRAAGSKDHNLPWSDEKSEDPDAEQAPLTPVIRPQSAIPELGGEGE